MNRKDPEHWEKYALLLMTLGGYVLLAFFSAIAVVNGTQGAEIIVGTFGALVFASMAFMTLRKIAKYKTLSGFKIGQDGIEVSFNEGPEQTSPVGETESGGADEAL